MKAQKIKIFLFDLIDNNKLDRTTNNSLEKEILYFPFKVLKRIGETIEKGAFLTKSIFVRKEIWFQENAKIAGLHLKYEAYKTISDKMNNLTGLFHNQNVININNVTKFCDDLIEIQNSISKEFTYIKPILSGKNSDLQGSSFYKKFQEISNKIKSNLLSLKMISKPDFVDIQLKMIKGTSDLRFVLENMKLTKEDEIKLLKQKIQIISGFFSQSILKLILNDIKELVTRFLKKKILRFEKEDNENQK